MIKLLTRQMLLKKRLKRRNCHCGSMTYAIEIIECQFVGYLGFNLSIIHQGPCSRIHITSDT